MTAAFSVGLDDYPAMVDKLDRRALDDLLRQTAERLHGLLRDGDYVAHVDDGVFEIALNPVQRLDLELCIQLSARLQAAAAEPVAFRGQSILPSVSVGFCTPARKPGADGDALLTAARFAMIEARRNGPSAIRAYSEDMRRTAVDRTALHEEIQTAIETGQIVAYFQPQISTETGQVSGMEALARWIHPEHGVIHPADFLLVVEEEGLFDRLGEVMLFQALSALVAWDAHGFDVPCVGVNFSDAELRNPKLVDKIAWELDRFELVPSRLCIEILETVFSTVHDGIVTRNIAELSDLGCLVDLDDFGTGHASITHIQKFDVDRIKIDRSFIAGVDDDPDRQRLVSAILTMAEQLGVATIAEGVEKQGEHAMLAQLGCRHVQGYGLARPMPLADTFDWIGRFHASLAEMPRIGQRSA